MLKVDQRIRTSGAGKLKVIPFFKIKEDNQALRKTYEDYFIEKFQPSLNVCTQCYSIVT